MAVLPIKTVPDPILTRKAQKVKGFGEETKKIVRDLLDTLETARDPEGAGLAAPQLGYDKSICVTRKFFRDPKDQKTILHEDIVLINPKTYGKSKEGDLDWEGCLSIPNVYGKVERSKRVKVKAVNEKGEPFRMTANGVFARVILHEIDHLNGVLFTDLAVGETISEEEFTGLLEADVQE